MILTLSATYYFSSIDLMTTVMLYFGINIVSAVKDAEVVITSILKDFFYFLICRAFDLQMQL